MVYTLWMVSKNQVLVNIDYINHTDSGQSPTGFHKNGSLKGKIPETVISF